jgi:hypothetical protein
VLYPRGFIVPGRIEPGSVHSGERQGLNL